jgi:hypothetical protein
MIQEPWWERTSEPMRVLYVSTQSKDGWATVSHRATEVLRTAGRIDFGSHGLFPLAASDIPRDSTKLQHTCAA